MVGVRLSVLLGVALAVGLGSGAVLTGPEGASAARPDAPGGPVIAGIARVIDGDTVEIDGTRIRIQGIDAPETDDRCRLPDGRPWLCGEWSTEIAEARFGGRNLECHDLGERSWGRVVARCMLGETDMAAEMVGLGAARACPRFALQHPHSRPYMALEAEAAAAGRGIFDGTPPPLAGFCVPERPRADARARDVQPTPAADRRDCAIKGNINARGERIYHMPGQAHYDRTVIDEAAGQRWFCSPAEAEAAGWRRALR